MKSRLRPSTRVGFEKAPARVRSAERFGSPGQTLLLELQRTAGNQAVASWISSQREAAPKPVAAAKPKKKKKAPETLQVVVGADGLIRTSDADATLVGFKAADGSTYVKSARDNQTATLQPVDGDAIELVKLHEATLTAAADGSTSATVTATSVFAELDTGGGIVVNAKGEPQAPKDMPASLADVMVADVRIAMPDDKTWVLLTMPGGVLRWFSASHKKADFEKARKDLEAEEKNLPETMKAKFTDVSKVVTLVSVLEGGFDATTSATDKMRSLGIFQWGMKRDQSADIGSLGDFFRTLKNLATTAEAKKKADRTEEDKLYIDAWKQCTDQGLDVKAVDGKIRVTVNGDVAEGQDVEDTMKDEMGKGKLKTYQLVAAMQWIDEMKAKIVMPGPTPIAKRYVKNGYRQYNEQQVTLQGPTRSFKLEDSGDTLTVGDVCSSEEALATAANVLPNRPHWVETAVWRTISPDDVDTQIGDLLKKIEAAEPAPSPPAKGKGKGKGKAKPPPQLTGETVTDTKSFEQLQALIWPATATVDDQTLINGIEAAALELYKATGDTYAKKKRPQRLASTHVLDW